VNIIAGRARDAKYVDDYWRLYIEELRWPVLPIYEPICVGQKAVCSCALGKRCDRPGKHPRTRHGVRDATTDEKRAWDWWWDWPEANIAIATGQASGTIVLDIDPRSGGDKTMVALGKRLGRLPPAPAVETGGGGCHLYFSYPKGAVLRAKAGPGVDIQGDGDYVVAPLSRHVNGPLYRWIVRPDECPPPPLPPDWLVAITTPDLAQFCGREPKWDTLTGGTSMTALH